MPWWCSMKRRRTEQRYEAIWHELRHLERQGRILMTSITQLKDEVANLALRVKNEDGAVNSAVVLIQGLLVQNKQMQDKLAALDPDTVTQDDIDGLVGVLKDMHSAVDTQINALAQAVGANGTTNTVTANAPVDADPAPSAPATDTGSGDQTAPAQDTPASAPPDSAPATASAQPDTPQPSPVDPAASNQ